MSDMFRRIEQQLLYAHLISNGENQNQNQKLKNK